MRTKKACLVWICAASLAAQTDPGAAADRALSDLVVPRLASDDMADVAWGAHLASRHVVTSAERPLLAALRRLRDVDGEGARQARLHIVDALWNIGATLTGDEFEPLLADPLLRVPTFLLFARDLDANGELLGRLAMQQMGPSDTVAYTAGALLVDDTPKNRRIDQVAFVEHLLATGACTLHLTVRDGGPPPDGQWTSAIGLDSGPYYRHRRRFPPLVEHELVRCWHRYQLRPSEGPTTVIRTGRDPLPWPRDPANEAERGRMRSPTDVGVVHRRRVVGRLPVEDLERRPLQPAPHPDTALAWLEHMSGVALPTGASLTVEWQGEDALRAAVEAKCAELREGTEAVLRHLAEARWLPNDTTDDYRLPIELHVWDRRHDKETELPDVRAPTR